jgi:protein tyrosine/serine phosphatase
MSKREIRLAGMFNVRDIGGVDTAGGGRVRTGHLYRAAGLHRLTEAERDAVAELGLRTVFDLRTAAELEDVGEFPAAHVEVVRHHAPMMQRAWRVDGAGGRAADMLSERYVEMLITGRDAVGLVVKELAAPDALPAAFFCAAGKDRTGVMAALLLALVGVSDDDIVADYEQSEANMPALIDWMRANEPDTQAWMDRLPQQLHQSPAEAMHILLDALRGEYGSVESYVLSCGATPESVAALRTALVV